MMHFKDSSFEDIDTETFKGIYELPEEVVELTANPIVDDESKASKVEEKNARFKELQAKWGNYQSLEFLERCESLYKEFIDGGYQILSAMHQISLMTYVQLQVKWDEAMQKMAQGPRQAEWEAFMSTFQQCGKDERSDEKWHMMERMFHVYEEGEE